MVWDRDDYIKEAQIQLEDESFYRKINYKEKLLSELVDKSSYFFLKSLKEGNVWKPWAKNYFTYEYKKAFN